jgi:hypothetical protein
MLQVCCYCYCCFCYIKFVVKKFSVMSGMLHLLDTASAFDTIATCMVVD